MIWTRFADELHELGMEESDPRGECVDELNWSAVMFRSGFRREDRRTNAPAIMRGRHQDRLETVFQSLCAEREQAKTAPDCSNFESIFQTALREPGPGDIAAWYSRRRTISCLRERL